MISRGNVLMSKLKFVGFQLDIEEYKKFYKKYGKNSASKIREYIHKEIENDYL